MQIAPVGPSAFVSSLRPLLFVVAITCIASLPSIATAQKGKPGGGGSSGPAPTGTVFYFNGVTKAMRPDGTGSIQVLPVIDSTHFLFPEDADPTQPHALGGVPCDQVQGSDPFHDRWYLASVCTNTYDEIHFPDGTKEYSWPHNDVFAFRTDPANRSNLIIVRLTDWYGRLLHNNTVPQWSNDSNETVAADGTPLSYVGGLYAREISSRFEMAMRPDGSQYSIVHMDWYEAPLVGRRLPITASQIELAARLGIRDISGTIESYALAIPDGMPLVSPDGSYYASSDNRLVTLRYCLDRSPVRVLWDGNAGVEPVSPANFVYSRDGNRLAFINGGWREYSSSGGVWTMPVTGGENPKQLVRNVQKGLKTQRYGDPHWSPDSQHLLVGWSYDNNGVILEEALYVMPSAGGTLVNITPGATGFVRAARWVSNTPSPVSP